MRKIKYKNHKTKGDYPFYTFVFNWYVVKLYVNLSKTGLHLQLPAKTPNGLSKLHIKDTEAASQNFSQSNTVYCSFIEEKKKRKKKVLH